MENPSLQQSPPPSPPAKPSSSAHSRDTSLQHILRQFDPLSPERQSIDKAPVPPPKDSSPPVPVSPTSKPEVPEKDTNGSRSSVSLTRRHSISSVEKPPPAEPDVPFDFHRFLEQMRHKSADGVARYMKSFLQEFNKRSWTVSEQQKIFISYKIPLYEPWATASPNEYSNALEGMEKLIMNRLYSRTFAPAALASIVTEQNDMPGSPTRVSEAARDKLGNLMDDIERDRVLAERIEIFDWVGPKELEIPDGMVEGGEKFLGLAEQELLKINNYRAPRDKVICILNSSKVLFGLIRQSHLVNKDTSADSFLPLLILLLLRSNPPHLYSNIQYIQRFRSPDRLGGEGGYYLNSLEAAVGWIEGIEKGVLNCSEEEFDRNVESAVARIAEKHRLEAESLAIQAQSPPPSPRRTASPQTFLDRTSRLALNPTDRDRPEILGPTRDLLVSSSGKVVGAVKKPLKGLGNLVFGETGESPSDGAESSAGPTAEPSREREEDAALRLANAEIASAERAEREQRGQTLEMLTQMFPDLDKEVVEAVIVAKDGRVGVCIDICLEMSSGIQTPNEPHEVERESPESHSARSGKENGKAPQADSADLLGLEGEEGIGSMTIDDESRGRNRADQVDLMS